MQRRSKAKAEPSKLGVTFYESLENEIFSHLPVWWCTLLDWLFFRTWHREPHLAVLGRVIGKARFPSQPLTNSCADYPTLGELPKKQKANSSLRQNTQMQTHTTVWKSITKVTPFSNKGPILNRDSISFHLSHPPPLLGVSLLCSKSDTSPAKSDNFIT